MLGSGRTAAIVLLLAATAGAFLVANSRRSGRYVYEEVPADRRPIDMLVDTDPIPGVVSPIVVAQQLMDRWNIVPGTEPLFGVARAGGGYSGANAQSAFGVFTNRQHEIAFDDDGSILAAYGLSTGVLGITLKIVDPGSGNVLDTLIVINTQPGALVPPRGSGATTTELFEGTLLHELGHVLGLGHSAVGMSNGSSVGLSRAAANQIPTMYPFRLPFRPQEGRTLELDDEAGVRFRYANANIGRGSISGTVRGLSGAPVNQIAVRAIGPGTLATSHIGVLSDTDSRGEGNYKIPDLPAGSYQVLIETVNGRSGVDAGALAGSDGPLGSRPFVLAQDEFWQRGDTYDPAVDNPFEAGTVQVRAERDTGGVDFVLNATPIVDGQTRGGSLSGGDARVPDDSGASRYTDFFVFQGQAGQTVTLLVEASGFTPELRLLRPSSFSEEEADTPNSGTVAQLSERLDQSGVYTVSVATRGSAGAPGGSGTYNLSIAGSGGSLPAVPSVTGAALTSGPANAAIVEVGSPSCDIAVLQMLARAPSHEELWIDRIDVRTSGSGDESQDVDSVGLALDRDGDGRYDPGEPILAAALVGADNGTVSFTGLELEFGPGTETSLLVVYSVDFAAPPATAGLSAWWGLLVLLPLALVRKHARAAALLCLVFIPLACGGGGGGGGGADPSCFTAFDATAATVSFEAEVRPGDVRAFRSAGSATTPLAIPATPILSGTLIVSRAS